MECILTGIPRALVGAMLYAYSLAYIFSLETTLEYGELIEELINKKEVWGNLPNVNNIEAWKEEAQRYLSIDYDILWKDCVNETVEYTQNCKRGYSTRSAGYWEWNFGEIMLF